MPPEANKAFGGVFCIDAYVIAFQRERQVKSGMSTENKNEHGNPCSFFVCRIRVLISGCSCR